MPLRLDRERRIRRNSEYRLVYDTGRKRSGRYLVCFCRTSGTVDKNNAVSARLPGPVARVGITVSGKVGKAHERNRAKRRIKEALRSELEGFGTGAEIVFVAKRGILTASFEDLRTDVRTLLNWCAS